jgi:hypothetical protein
LKPTATKTAEANPAALDRILTAEEELLPSSGFLASVMERVQEEAAAPPPIPFPWKRAIPGILVAAAVLGGGAVELIRHVLSGASEISLAPPQLPAVVARPLPSVGWVALALGASLLSWMLSHRLAGRSGLL